MRRNDHCAVFIGMNDVVVGSLHAKNIHSLAEIDNMNVSMTGANAASDDLKVLR